MKLLFIFMAAVCAFGQDPRGTIMGRVSDPSQAAIPAAEVRATNTATGVSVSVKTNEAGSYSIPFLLPGAYVVTSETIGFKKYSREGVQLRVSDTVELNITLQVGDVTESVEVSAETPLLETASSSLGQVMDERRILELPLMGGNPVELAFLTPGILTNRNMQAMKAAFNATAISADGNRAFANEFQFDGVSNTFADGRSGARDAFRPPPTAIKEFKIQTSSYDASIGHTVGATINASSAAGTNELHGEAHYWAKNSAFDAPNFFNNKNNTKPPAYRDHRYGASGGGPVYLPKVYDGRNRTFWYYAWEANKWTAPLTFTGTVPTAGQRRGDFSDLLAQGSRYQIYDPATIRAEANGRYSRQPLPNNIIPSSRLDKVGLALMEFYPLPNQAGTSDGRNNFFRSYNADEDYYVHLWRVDHAVTDNHRMFVRLHYDHWLEDKQDIFGNRINGIILKRINRGAAFDNVFVLGPTLVMNVRYGLTNQEFPEQRVTRGFDLSKLGFSPELTNLVDKDLATAPRLLTGAYSGVSNWESGDGTNTGLTHTFANTFTKLRGSHNMKFGADYRVYRAFANRFPRDVSPELSFSNFYTRGPLDNSPAAPIGQELAAMLFGIPGGSMTRSASSAMQDQYIGVFFHDDWKVTRKLTLNLGLRYEYETPITERYDRLVAEFAVDESNPIEAQARANYARNPIAELPVEQFRVRGGLTLLNSGGIGRSPYAGERNNFMPRFGFAYQLFPKTTLRGGYGLFYDTLGVNSTFPVQLGFSQSTPIQASLDNGLTFLATNANPFPNGLLSPLGPAGGLSTNLGQGLEFFYHDMKHAYSQRWSFGLQHLLPGSVLVDASYVGNRGTRIGVDRAINSTPAQYLSTKPHRDNETINYLTATVPNPFAGTHEIYGAMISRGALLRPYPHFGDITVTEPIGYSWYHSLQSRIEKRFSQGYTFQLSYTWSKLMEAVNFLNPTDPMPYEVIGGFDRTHRLSASGIWEIPVGRGRHFGAALPGVVEAVAGGWQLGGLVAIQSGAPLGFGNVIFNGDVKDVVVPESQRHVDRWINIDAGFNRDSNQQLSSNIRAFPLRFGGIREDTLSRWDFSLIKNFRLYEDVTFQFRAEVFNAWNHPSFRAPNTSPTNSAFGRVTGTMNEPRSWQFSGKLKF